jgi:hypothetical protein
MVSSLKDAESSFCSTEAPQPMEPGKDCARGLLHSKIWEKNAQNMVISETAALLCLLAVTIAKKICEGAIRSPHCKPSRCRTRRLIDAELLAHTTREGKHGMRGGAGACAPACKLLRRRLQGCLGRSESSDGEECSIFGLPVLQISCKRMVQWQKVA